MSKERLCIVCGQSYLYCPHCDKNNKQNRWKINYCSENCRDVFKTCSNYEGGLISLEEAYDTLIKLNIQNVKDSVKATVNKIMTYKPIVEVKSEEPVEIIEEKPKHRPRRKRLKKTDE